MAANQHEKIAVAYMVGTSLSLGFAGALMAKFGTAGAAAALLCIDAGMAWLVLHVALRQLADTPAEFASAMFSVPNLAFLRNMRGDLA
jgi:O-antigen/teichoic acid export membrane protein